MVDKSACKHRHHCSVVDIATQNQKGTPYQVCRIAPPSRNELTQEELNTYFYQCRYYNQKRSGTGENQLNVLVILEHSPRRFRRG
jgi:hypothetical protein